MGKTLNLGHRIELLPMDKHCEDISLGLYQQPDKDGPRFLVHTYSRAEAVHRRVAFIRAALKVMTGLQEADRAGGWMRFPCRALHLRAIKRAFLDLCKLETDAPLTPKPLVAFDKKAGCNLKIVSLGDGRYETSAEHDSDAASKRATALARGYAKLCELALDQSNPNRVAFDCQKRHDELIGMLMFRAQNVRASMREQEMAASRGVLSSPSEQ